MSDHTKALVPIESWCYNSPEMRAKNRTVDIGLLAEALIYYDQVLLNVTNQKQFAEVLDWFISQDSFPDFLGLLNDGTIHIFDYGFVSAPLWDEAKGLYLFGNMQDPVQAKPNTFKQRFIEHPRVAKSLGSKKTRKRLAAALRGNVTEEKASDYGKAVEDTRDSLGDAHIKALALQVFVDELYRYKGLGSPPKVTAIVVTEGDKNTTTFNLNFDELTAMAGADLNFGPHTILAGMGNANKFLWSAARHNCDIFLGKPMGQLVGDKLYESGRVLTKSSRIIETLRGEVEFPDIRDLVNNGKIDLKEILRIRSRAKRFRAWLKDESERDRNAIIAYHNEVARELGYVRSGRKILSLFGVIGGGALGGVAGTAIDGHLGGAVGGMMGAATGYVCELAAKLGANWKPVVFGDWVKSRIQKIVGE